MNAHHAFSRAALAFCVLLATSAPQAHAATETLAVSAPILDTATAPDGELRWQHLPLAHPESAHPGQARPGQTRPERARPDNAHPGEPQPGQEAPEQVDISAFSVVEVRGTAAPDARSNAGGRHRQGGGIVIDDKGLVLTIAYLVTETEKIEIITNEGSRIPASLVGYDSASGLGLIRAALPLPVTPIGFADSAQAAVSDPVLVVGFDGVAPAYIVSRREFAGTWEYLLDEALFTAPATTGWSGAALIDRHGKLLGVGSLLVQDVLDASLPMAGNMFVPIDLLKPILGSLVARGKADAPPRPWLGVNVQDLQGRLLVTKVSEGGPAASSGVAQGDIILGLDGKPLKGLADFYRRLWSSGHAGTEVQLEVLQGNQIEKLKVRTIERAQYLRPPSTY